MGHTRGDILSFKTPLHQEEMVRRGLVLYKWEAPLVNGFVDMDEAIYFYRPFLTQ